MRTFGFSAKTMSILFLLVIIFISLAISGYSFIVSNHAATLPSLPAMEGMDNKQKKEDKRKEGVMTMTKPKHY
jgi:flagellar basal body-associated protein FliL